LLSHQGLPELVRPPDREAIEYLPQSKPGIGAERLAYFSARTRRLSAQIQGLLRLRGKAGALKLLSLMGLFCFKA
jgi:hypothetical protein